MRVKLTALTVGAAFGCFLLVSLLSSLNEGEMSVRNWIALLLVSAAGGAAAGLLWFYGQRFLHKYGYSAHDDEDFDE